jgi:tetratricopeptide (TPR) repeat protein
LLNAEHDQAREEVCDNYVLKELNPKEYSKCIASLAERVCLISELPAAAGMAGRHFKLQTRVERILSQKGTRTMRANLSFKLMIFAINASATLAIAGFQGQVHLPNVTVIPHSTVSAAPIPIVAANIVPTPSPTPIPAQNQGDSTSASMGPKEARAEEFRLESKALHLTDEQALELEQQLSQDPQNIQARSLLMPYYLKKETAPIYRRSQPTESKYYESVLWLTQNMPEAPILGSLFISISGQLQRLLPADEYVEKLAALWQQHLKEKPDNLMILWNAANFYRFGNIDLTIECLTKLKNLDSKDADFLYAQLGQAYQSKIIRNPNETSLAKAALNAFENAQASSAPGTSSNLILNLGKFALAAGKFDKAADYANKMLVAADNASGSDTSRKGDLIFSGHYVLGMIAVKKGDWDEAGKQLLASADMPESSRLNSAGPNTSLAQALLDHGRSKVVLEFLQKCSKFWRKPDGTIIPLCSKWIQQMEEGQIPDFKAQQQYPSMSNIP